MLSAQPQIHEIQDRYEFITNYANTVKDSWVSSHNYDEVMTFKTNLIDGTINVHSKNYYRLGTWKLMPFVNEQVESFLNFAPAMREGDYGAMFHHQHNKLPKIDKLDMISFLYRFSMDSVKNTYTSNATIRRTEEGNQLVGSFKDKFKISTVNELNFYIPRPGELINKSDDPGQWSTKSNHLIFSPRPYNQMEHNVTLFDIYIANDNNNRKTAYDHGLANTKISYSSSSLPKSMNVGFFKTNLDDEGKPDYYYELNKRYEKLGEFRITDHSYYDYETGKTKVGLNPGSKLGEIIPYSFEGDYTRKIKFDANASFKDIEIMWTDRIEFPILENGGGLIRLDIDSNFDAEVKKLRKLDKKEVDYIRRRYKSDKNYSPSLVWYERNLGA